jgi:hypothetical protein
MFLSSLAVGMLLVPVSLLFLKPMTRELTTCVVAVSVLVFMFAMSVMVEAGAYDTVLGGAAYVLDAYVYADTN